jgi:hypothetical protein
LGLRVLLHVPVVDCPTCFVKVVRSCLLCNTGVLSMSKHILHAIRSCRIVLIVIRPIPILLLLNTKDTFCPPPQ